MKARQIDKIIREKITALALAHPPIKDELLQNSIVTGGCIASMLLKEKVNDYDIYFDSLPALTRVMEYFGGKTGALYLVAFNAGAAMPKQGHTVIEPTDEDLVPVPVRTETTDYALYSDLSSLRNNENVKYISLYYKSTGYWTAGENTEKDDKTHVIKFASANAVTLSEKVQLVFRFFGPAREIHENYDFVHATNFWTLKTGLVTNTDALEAILARELVYKGSRFPLASIFRTRKFIQRGWTLHIANYVKMAFQLNELDLTNIHTLREQLTGVDAAYLNAIIHECETSLEPITTTYVCELVDKLIRGGQDEEKEDGHDAEQIEY